MCAEPGLLIGGVCAEQVQLQEVAVCFGGQLMRGNRAQKVNASNYQAFDSPTYHKLALLGVEVDWQARYLLQVILPFQHLQCLHRPACCSFVVDLLTVLNESREWNMCRSCMYLKVAKCWYAWVS